MFSQVSLTTGNFKKALLLFALPLFFSQLFQTLYNTMDTVIIGHCLGDISLAAVGAVGSLFELLVGFCTGFGQGLSIIAAQKYGAQDEQGFRHSVGLSIFLAGLISVVISVLAGIFMRDILHFMNTSEEIIDQSYAYISIISAGLIITVFYNLCAGMLRAIGDSFTPLVILVISSVLNIGLDLLFIAVFDWGVAGAAIATLLAQVVSLVVCIIWVFKTRKDMLPGRQDFKWDGALGKNLTEMGLSMALMSSIVSVGSLILQIAINSQGTLIVTGHTSARKLFQILNLPPFALMFALSSYVAQNVGAKKVNRANNGIVFANRVGVIYSLVLTAVVFVFANRLIRMISGTSSQQVIETGAMYLRWNVPFFPFLCVLLNTRTALQAMELKTVPIISSVIELVGKILFTLVIVPATGYLGVCLTEPAVWIVMCVFLCWYYLRNPVFKEYGLKARIL